MDKRVQRHAVPITCHQGVRRNFQLGDACTAHQCHFDCRWRYSLGCTLENEKLNKSKFSKPAYHDILFGDVEYTIVDFDVLDGWVSFHHSLHWLLAELLKNVDMLSEESVKSGRRHERAGLVYTNRDRGRCSHTD